VFLGNLAFDAKWWERSEDAYRQALANGNREGLEGLFNIADALQKQGRPGDAADLLKRAIPLAPKDAELQAEEARYREMGAKKADPQGAGADSGKPAPGN
jgi:tetratricopeptide (TPR) repeat protein